jgi:hypothetical protein
MKNTYTAPQTNLGLQKPIPFWSYVNEGLATSLKYASTMQTNSVIRLSFSLNICTLIVQYTTSRRQGVTRTKERSTNKQENGL